MGGVNSLFVHRNSKAQSRREKTALLLYFCFKNTLEAHQKKLNLEKFG